MKTTNWYRYFLPALLAGLLFTACSKGLSGGGEGTLSFQIEENDEVLAKGASETVYRITITDQSGETVAQYPDHRNLPASIRLVEGQYTVHASQNDPEDAGEFGRPLFAGSQELVVERGKHTAALITCRLQNVKICVEEFDPEIQDNFTSYSLTVKQTEQSDREMVFTQQQADEGQIGWITPTDEGTFVLIFRAVNMQSSDEKIYIRTIKEVQAADFYRLSIGLQDDQEGNPSDGGSLFRVSVRTEAYEYEFTFGLGDDLRAIPALIRKDGKDISRPVTTNEALRNGEPVIIAQAEAGIRRLRIMHEDQTLLAYGLPGVFYLGGGPQAENIQQVRQQLAGLVTWDAVVVGENAVEIDFSGLMNDAEVGGEKLPEGSYDIEVEVYDNDLQMMNQVVTLSVVNELATGSADPWGYFAYLSGEWMTDDQPANLTFEYRVRGTGTWTTWTGAVTINAAEHTFTARVNGLQPATQYEFRAAADDTTPGTTVVFRTEEAPEIPNLNFEYGYSKTAGSGMAAASNVWSPNIPGVAEFWGTGNAGTKNSNAFDQNLTSQVSGADAVSGNALKLESKYLDKIVIIVQVKTFAAGSLFSGYFEEMSGIPSMDPEDQRALIHYGRPFTGRPLGLKGWYKYTSTTVNRDISNLFPELIAAQAPDSCKIYIGLENWGNASERPENPTVVGYAEFATAESTDVYKPFEIRIEYFTTTIKPTHVVMGATSSYHSDDFCGGEGSTLYIDEFEMIWDE